jgi:hypothetical protein
MLLSSEGDMNYAVKGAIIGGASALVVPSFIGVVVRFFLINIVELMLLWFVTGRYEALTNQPRLDKLALTAAPKPSELVVINPQVVGRMLVLTFANNSPRALENVRFWCGWTSKELDQYEDPTDSPDSLTTRKALGHFEPKTSYRLTVPLKGYPSRNPNLSDCRVLYDHFDLGRAIRNQG